jgi:PDDEXK-like uncharacterized protein DUF3799
MLDMPDIADGVYFCLDAETYHRVPALSASGIKNLLISAPDFWYRCPWLNPNFEEEESDSAALIAGRAYHKRIVEGRGEFNRTYAETFQPPKGAVSTIDQMTEELAKVAIKLPSKAKRPDYLAAIRENCPDVPIADDAEKAYGEIHDGKQFLSADLIAKIEIAAAMIEKHPTISKCFSGGFPEVTVIWTEDGVRFKARLDYMKPRAIVDLKTFANFLNKPVDAAIYSAMAGGKYHIQAAFYMRAFAAAQRQPNWHGCNFDFRVEHKKCVEPGFYFVFQQKGPAPLARAKKFLKGSVRACGEAAIEQGIRRFKECSAKFGDLPWVDDEPISEFEDLQFPAYAVEL